MTNQKRRNITWMESSSKRAMNWENDTKKVCAN